MGFPNRNMSSSIDSCYWRLFLRRIQTVLYGIAIVILLVFNPMVIRETLCGRIHQRGSSSIFRSQIGTVTYNSGRSKMLFRLHQLQISYLWSGCYDHDQWPITLDVESFKGFYSEMCEAFSHPGFHIPFTNGGQPGREVTWTNHKDLLCLVVEERQ